MEMTYQNTIDVININIYCSEAYGSAIYDQRHHRCGCEDHYQLPNDMQRRFQQNL